MNSMSGQNQNYVRASKRAIAVSLLCVFGLVACGGGGSGSEPTPTPTPTPTPIAATVSLLSGSIGSVGDLDGVGTVARFNNPQGLARDALGNMYVADQNNRTLRKIATNGTVTTLAGLSGVSGSNDGIGNQARFAAPSGVAVDASGNAYVVDGSNIRKVTSAGVVSTLVLRGPADFSQNLNGSIAVDTVGNLYVPSILSVLKISPTGNVSYLVKSNAGPGLGGWSSYGGIAVANDGTVYVTNPSSHTVHKITPDGVVTTIAGAVGALGHADGQGAVARFSGPSAIVIDQVGNLYVTDDSNTVRKITPGGLVFSTPNVGYNARVGEGSRGGISTDSAGNLFVVKPSTSSVLKVDATNTVTTFAGPTKNNGAVDGSAASAGFSNPESLASDRAGNVYVLDARTPYPEEMKTKWLRTVSPQGVVSTIFSGAFDNDNSRYIGVTVDSAGNAYFGQQTWRPSTMPFGYGHYEGGAIIKQTPNGSRSTLWSSTTVTPARLAIDAAGNVFFTNSTNPTLTKLSPAGAELAQWAIVLPSEPLGSSWSAGPVSYLTNRLNIELAVDSTGAVFLSAFNTVRKIDAAGTMTIVAGKLLAPGTADGAGATAAFGTTTGGLAFDAVGNLYLADTDNHTIRKITSAGVVSTVVGKVNSVGIALGNLPGSLYRPTGLTIDSGGNLYVGSAGAVLKLTQVAINK